MALKPTIYISGPMTMSGFAKSDRAAFNEAARRLSEKGWQPVSPADIERILPCVEDDGTCNDVARRRLMDAERHIVANCDALYLLNGWERSVGAKGELAHYMQEGPFHIHIYLESNGVPDALKRPEGRTIGMED